jgi:hypothetical protein
LPFVLYGCETWSLKLREKYRLRCFEIRALRGIFGPTKERQAGNGGNCTLGSFMASYSANLFRVIKSWRMLRDFMWHVWRKRKMRTGFRWEDLKERYRLEDLGVDGRIILKNLKNRSRGSGWDWSTSRQEQKAGYCEYDSEFSASVKCEELLASWETSSF